MTGQIQELRHKARDSAYQAYTMLASPLVSDAVAESLTMLLQELKGVEGFSKDQQVERLASLEARATALRDNLNGSLTPEAVAAVVEERRAKILAALDTVEASVSEAKTVAESRDFDKYLSEKRAMVPDYEPSDPWDDEDD
jgi:hypothetical protein